MTKLPEKNVLDGNKQPRTTTGEMKSALGKLRDYLKELLGEDSSDKEAARQALGINLKQWAEQIDSKADSEEIQSAIQNKVDRSELEGKTLALEAEIAKRGTPVGSIDYFAMATPPAGYLKADGSQVGRETYPDLFAAIGTTFGSGDGSTTFNLPDLIDRFAEGSSTPGVKREAGLPNIAGVVGPIDDYSSSNLTGSFYNAGAIGYDATSGNTGNGWKLGFDASRSNPIYGASETVQPPSLTLLPCIKAFDAATNPGLIDVTALAGDMNAKLDKSVDGKPVRYVTDAFSDGTNWFRTWSDGWLEQGGTYDHGKNEAAWTDTITLPQPFANASYTVSLTQLDASTQTNIAAQKKTGMTFEILASPNYGNGYTQRYAMWSASGEGL
ncbi:phage tail protein [Oxalobacter formigenes]|uniref:phage tail protein n=1 Tax=Oxalobacter formigenes TaxID=847 RepID=UPI00241F22DA|nr:phage tail protein [Oxalobacter formigenes]